MTVNTISKQPWNNGKLVGQNLPFKLKEIWAIRVRLQIAGKMRDLALFNLAIDSKLRGSDLVKIIVGLRGFVWVISGERFLKVST